LAGEEGIDSKKRKKEKRRKARNQGPVHILVVHLEEKSIESNQVA